MKTSTHNALSALTIALVIGMSGTSMAGGSETQHSVYDLAAQHNAQPRAPASARTSLTADDDGWPVNTRHSVYHLAAQQQRQAGPPTRSGVVQRAAPDDAWPVNTRHTVYHLADQLNRQRAAEKAAAAVASKPTVGPQSSLNTETRFSVYDQGEA